jgi:hypothetical protein
VVERAKATKVIFHEQNNDLLGYVVNLIITAYVVIPAESYLDSINNLR